MSTEGLARSALADIELVAQLRSAFAEAQSVMGHTLAGLGLTDQRYHLLLVIASGGADGTIQGALAAELRCPESRISLLVHELVEAGLVEAVRDGFDRRQVRVRLLREGEEVIGRAILVQRDALHTLVANVEVSEVTRLAELVARTYLGLELSVSVKAPQPRPAPRGRRAAAPLGQATAPRPRATAS